MRFFSVNTAILLVGTLLSLTSLGQTGNSSDPRRPLTQSVPISAQAECEASLGSDTTLWLEEERRLYNHLVTSMTTFNETTFQHILGRFGREYQYNLASLIRLRDFAEGLFEFAKSENTGNRFEISFPKPITSFGIDPFQWDLAPPKQQSQVAWFDDFFQEKIQKVEEETEALSRDFTRYQELQLCIASVTDLEIDRDQKRKFCSSDQKDIMEKRYEEDEKRLEEFSAFWDVVDTLYIQTEQSLAEAANRFFETDLDSVKLNLTEDQKKDLAPIAKKAFDTADSAYQIMGNPGFKSRYLELAKAFAQFEITANQWELYLSFCQ